jgi:serine/threonine protein kinase
MSGGFDAGALVGQEVDGYRLVKLLGRGTTGAVYLALRDELRRSFAIKILVASDDTYPEPLQKFEREIEILQQIHSSYVVEVSGRGRFQEHPYYVMQYVDGDTLEDLFARGISRAEYFDYMAQLLRGLDAIHEQKVVHRDLKAKNVMVTRDHFVKIVDFGFAIPQGQTQSLGPRAAQPEATDRHHVDPDLKKTRKALPESDVYAFGWLLRDGLEYVKDGLPREERNLLLAIAEAAIEKAGPPENRTAQRLLERLLRVSDVSYAFGADRDALRLLAVPELAEVHSTTGVVRIPELADVPLTKRVRRLIDTPDFQSLRNVSQLGLGSV